MDDCRCSKKLDQPVPAKVTAKLRLEKAGRGGKSVTVVDALPDNGPFLEELAKALKKACAVGGTVRPGAIELAGDVRERVRPLLAGRAGSSSRAEARRLPGLAPMPARDAPPCRARLRLKAARSLASPPSPSSPSPPPPPPAPLPLPPSVRSPRPTGS